MLWRAVAALQYVTIAKRNVQWVHLGNQDAINVSGTQKNVSIIACVPDPYAFVAGNVQLIYDQKYNLSCHNCFLTNCLNASMNVTSFAVIKQPALYVDLKKHKLDMTKNVEPVRYIK
jgi:hypothetical protein